MKFRTRYTEMETVYANPGDRYKDVYELVIDESGKKKLKKVDKEDLQEMIDASAASVDIHMIMQRFNLGDQDAVMQRAQVFYDDVSNLPTKLQDLMNLNQQASNFFDSLSPDLKKLYGNNYLEFLFDPGKMVDEIKRRQIPEDSTESGKEVENDKQE